MSKYPKVSSIRRHPNKDKDGLKGQGKPCIVCGKNTIGEIFIEVDYFRGDDECVRACSEHIKNKKAVLEAYSNSFKKEKDDAFGYSGDSGSSFY